MRTRAFAAGACSGIVVTPMTVRSSTPEVWTEQLCNTAVNYQRGVSLVTCAIHILGRVGPNFRNQFAPPITYT